MSKLLDAEELLFLQLVCTLAMAAATIKINHDFFILVLI
jgi:hypothetical protein